VVENLLIYTRLRGPGVTFCSPEPKLHKYHFFHPLNLMRPDVIPNAHRGAIHALAYNSTGRYVLSGGQDKAVHLWNPSTKVRIQSYMKHSYEVLAIAVAADDSKFVSVGGDRNVHVWDVGGGATICSFDAHSLRINCACFNSEATIVASGSNDTTVKLWDCRSRDYRPIQTLSDAKDSITSVKIMGPQVLTGSIDGRVRAYDIRTGRITTDCVGQPVTCVNWSSDGNNFLVSSVDNHVRLFETATGKLTQSFTGHASCQFRATSAFFDNETTVASTSEDGKLYLWDISSGKIKDKLSSKTESETSHSTAFALDTHPSQPQLVTSSFKGTVEVWKP
jgi:mitogen-activated protein kinase organizer 1